MRLTTTNKEYDYEIMINDTKKLLCEYPFINKIKIGSSVLGKEIYCLKFGSGDKKIFINAAHHGKEWITSALSMRIIEELCFLYVNDISFGRFDLRKLFDKSSLYICPMVNPDGVNLSIHGLTPDIPQITKTRLISYNSQSKDFINKWQANINGVDLNHNYDAEFQKGKAYEMSLKIFSPCSSRFSGAYPESEPESYAIAEFTRHLAPHIVLALHSQGEEIYYNFNGKMAPLAEKMALNLAEITGYTASKPDGMASYSGYKDWVIDKFLIPAFTFEVGKGENPLPLSSLEDIFDKIFPAVLYLLNS